MKDWIKSCWGSYLIFIITPIVLTIFFLQPDIRGIIVESTLTWNHPRISRIFVGLLIILAIVLLILKVALWNFLWRKITKTQKPIKGISDSVGEKKPLSRFSKIVLFIIAPITIVIYSSINSSVNIQSNSFKYVVVDKLENYLFKHDSIYNVFSEPGIYISLILWGILTFCILYLWNIARGKNVGMTARMNGDTDRYTRVIIGAGSSCFILNSLAMLAVLNGPMGMFLWSEARWVWTVSDWFYTFTTIRVFAIFW